jgi:hypothetical protein
MIMHSAATEIRARLGLEHAQAVLGHAKAEMTQTYAALDMAKAREVIWAVG